MMAAMAMCSIDGADRAVLFGSGTPCASSTRDDGATGSDSSSDGKASSRSDSGSSGSGAAAASDGGVPAFRNAATLPVGSVDRSVRNGSPQPLTIELEARRHARALNEENDQGMYPYPPYLGYS